MESYHSYRVKILDKAFVIGDDKKHHKTAHVEMFDINGNRIDTREYGYVETDEIYKDIASQKNLDLNNCYVKDFSLNEFREKNKLSDNAYVEIHNFSAISAFFEAEAELDFGYAYFKGESVNFINTHFSAPKLNFLQSKFEPGDKDFADAHFDCKDINFQYADFADGQVSFKESIFKSENLSFINAQFGDGKTLFTGSNFGESNVAFQFARFGEGDISFEKTSFHGKKIDFSKVEFGNGKINFRLSEFGDGDISFDESEIGEGKLMFRRSKFGSAKVSFELAMMEKVQLTFERTEFGQGALSFYQATCDEVVFESSQLNNHLDLRFSKCRYIDLSNTIVRDIVDFTNVQGQVNIQVVNLSGMRNLGRLFIDWYDNNVKEMIFRQKYTTDKMKAEQFRLLKEEFHSLGQYTDEDKAYLEFKRLELKDRKTRALRANKLNALWFYPVYWGEYLIFDQIGHYATNPMRVLVSMIISFTFITFLYVVLILTTSADIVSSLGDPDKLPLVTKSIYHSAITFLTIGYGDYYPSGVIRWLSSIEGFVGLFLMSYFTVAFVRKVLR